MDAGSFVYEKNGVRWAMDLGMQNYFSLESKGVDLWNQSQEGQRWDVFRLNNMAHNTLTIMVNGIWLMAMLLLNRRLKPMNGKVQELI